MIHFLKYLTKKINLITKIIFKTKNEETLSLISANLMCNFLGLSTMATPFGLEAVTELKKEQNHDIDILLVMNYVGMSLLPISMLTLRNSYNSNFTLDVIPYIFVIALFNTVISILLVRVIRCFT